MSSNISKASNNHTFCKTDFCLSTLCYVAFAAAAVSAPSKPDVAPVDSRTNQTDLGEEMQSINKSLDGLLSELAVIKREATGRISQVRKSSEIGQLAASPNEIERIRQTKVSRFVLKRIAELESESLNMRDEMAKLFELSKKATKEADSKLDGKTQAKQDEDFDELPSSTTAARGTSQAETATTTTTSTAKPAQEEAAQIGFDLEQLKKLGEEIGKRVDQFGKDAAKNLGELFDGIKLVFRAPQKKPSDKSQSAPK